MKIPPPPQGCYPSCHQTDEEGTIKKWLNGAAIFLGILVGFISGFITVEMVFEIQNHFKDLQQQFR